MWKNSKLLKIQVTSESQPAGGKEKKGTSAKEFEVIRRIQIVSEGALQCATTEGGT